MKLGCPRGTLRTPTRGTNASCHAATSYVAKLQRSCRRRSFARVSNTVRPVKLLPPATTEGHKCADEKHFTPNPAGLGRFGRAKRADRQEALNEGDGSNQRCGDRRCRLEPCLGRLRLRVQEQPRVQGRDVPRGPFRLTKPSPSSVGGALREPAALLVCLVFLRLLRPLMQVRWDGGCGATRRHHCGGRLRRDGRGYPAQSRRIQQHRDPRSRG